MLGEQDGSATVENGVSLPPKVKRGMTNVMQQFRSEARPKQNVTQALPWSTHLFVTAQLTGATKDSSHVPSR